MQPVFLFDIDSVHHAFSQVCCYHLVCEKRCPLYDVWLVSVNIITLCHMCCWYRIFMEGTIVFKQINQFQQHQHKQQTSLAVIQRAYKAADQAAQAANLDDLSTL